MRASLAARPSSITLSVRAPQGWSQAAQKSVAFAAKSFARMEFFHRNARLTIHPPSTSMVAMDDFAKVGARFGGSAKAAATAHLRVALLDTPCRVDFDLTHRKQTMRVHSTRHTFRGIMCAENAPRFSCAFIVLMISIGKTRGFCGVAREPKTTQTNSERGGREATLQVILR